MTIPDEPLPDLSPDALDYELPDDGLPDYGLPEEEDEEPFE